MPPWKEKGFRKVGNADESVSPYLKAWIHDESTLVAGVIGEGTTKDLVANWTSPFADKSLGSFFGAAGGAAQAATGNTSLTAFNSRLVWEGNESMTLNLVFRLYALHDAKAEVADAILELEKMASPELADWQPLGWTGMDGHIPQRVSLNIGNMFIWKECVICGIQVPMDKEKTIDGHLIRADVNLQIKTLTMINKSLIASTYG